MGAMAVHLVPILEASGLATAAAVFMASLKGVAQVEASRQDGVSSPELILQALKQPDLRQMIEGSAGIVVGGTPAAYGQFIAQERAKWAPVIKAANITLD